MKVVEICEFRLYVIVDKRDYKWESRNFLEDMFECDY